MCALLFSLFSNDIPGHDSLGQEPEFSIKNSRVLWFRFDVIYVSLKKQVQCKKKKMTFHAYCQLLSPPHMPMRRYSNLLHAYIFCGGRGSKYK